MTFNEVLSQTIAMLHQHGRVSYRALKRQFAIQDDYLEDLKDAILFAHPEVLDEEGRGLVWMGDTGIASSAASAPVEAPGPAPLAYTPPYLAEKILTAKSALEGERKQVTVFFADLKGSTELIRDLDPEAAQRLLDPALHVMIDAVHRYEGTVNQVMGDGIMALFGAPVAHEDHAVRACYAALHMQEAISRYAEALRRQHGLDVQIRVGLNAGEVVVRAIGNDLHMDYTAVGQTTHLAARMEQLARPGTALLTADTLRLVEGYVEVTPLGPVPVKGLHEPIEVYELVRAGPVRSRLQAAVAHGLTRFVGRDVELESLRQALARAGAGQGQMVAGVGEAGVGKSRLFYEFTRSYHLHGWLLLASNSVSYGKGTAYLPVLDLLKGYFQIESHDDARRRREKITGKLLTLDRTLEPLLPALLALLEVPVDAPQWHAFDPPQRRRHTLEAIKRLLLRESQVQPLYLIFEDLHWIDAETQALLDSLVESLPTARLLLLVNYRPEYQHGWGSKTYYTQLRLDPLPPTSADAFLQALLGDDPGLASLTQLLIVRTQGNPFFLEESVRTLVETGVLAGERGAYRLAKPLESLQVPAAVQAVLAARIDRLPPEDKRLLQTAAVIGTEVPWPLVQAIADESEESLYRGLAHLQAAEFLYETSLFPERAYTFKHALTHEVAYGSLLLERRRGLHARLVEAIEALAPERAAEQVERLTHHALRGEIWDKALAYGRQAGDKAVARSANREAVTCFEQALAALAHLPESRARHEQAIDVRFGLRPALNALGDFGGLLEVLREAEGFVANFHLRPFAVRSPSMTNSVSSRSKTMAISFKGAHFPQDIILMGVRWYVAYPLSTRHVEELMEERGVHVDHSTINRWVIKYSPQLEEAFHRRKRPVWISWRMDETYIKIKGQWYYLYRAVDKHGQTIDFLLTEHRDTEAALRFLKKTIRRNGLPETITIDGSDANEAAIKRYNEEHGTAIAIRQVKYLNNVVEQDHRAVKRVTRPMLGFKAFVAAQDTLVGIELMHMIKKRQLVVEEGDKGLATAEQFYALAA